MPGKVIISRHSVGPHAGQKAPFDVRAVALELGASPIDLSPYNPRSFWTRICSTLVAGCTIVSNLGLARRADVLVLQHPLGRLNDLILVALTRRVPSITFVHDLEFLRWSRHSLREAQRMAHSNILIAHTAAMAQYLRPLAPKASIIELERFDYIVCDPPTLAVASASPRRVIIAGSLDPRKAPYVYELEQLALPLDLYGPSCDAASLRPGVEHQGVLASDRPALAARDGFGLVWDGTSTTRLVGPTGRYLRYNAPHKFSLYMALGIPVLVSRGSALAPLVEKRGLGLLIDDIPSGAESAAAVTPGRWAELIRNVETYRADLVRGKRTEEVLDRAFELLDAATPVAGAVRLNRSSRRRSSQS